VLTSLPGRTGVVGLSSGCQSGSKNIGVIAVCIFAMATFVPVIRHVNETARVIGIVECALVLVRFLMPLLEDIRGKD